MKVVKKVLVFIFLYSFNLFAQYPPLESLFEVETKTKHFIVIDVSLSMRRYFQNVINAINLIPPSLPSKDTVSIYKFADTPNLIASKPASNINRNDFPDSPYGQYTDIWAILEAILLEMQKSYQDIFIIFFLTDGRDEPPPGSHRSRDRWNQIINTARNILSKQTVIVYGIGLNQNTDIHFLRQIFGEENVRILIRSPLTLVNSINEIINQARIQRLRELVRKEIADGKIEIREKRKGKMKEGKIEIKYTIISHYNKLPVQIYMRKVNFREISGEMDTFTTIILPKKSKDFSIFIKKPYLKSFRIGRKIFYIRDTIMFNYHASFIHTPEIRRINLNPKINIEELISNIEIKIKYGIPISFLIILLCSFVLLVIFNRKWLSLSQPFLFGSITFRNKVFHLYNYKTQTIYILKDNDNISLDDKLDDKNKEKMIFSLTVKRDGPFERIYLKASENFSFLPEGEIKENYLPIKIGETSITLSGMRARLAPEKKWMNFLILLLILLLLNLLIFKVGL